MASTMNGGNGALIASERNNFFYGKLMDVTQFEKEQRYFNQKRLLLNRFVLGAGVISGLGMVVDPGDPRRVLIQPGLALDPLGRETVVPDAISVDPHQLTNDLGAPVGNPIDQGAVEIVLAYAEAQTDPVPVLVPDCDTPGNCAASTVREAFRILVRLVEGEVPQEPAPRLGEFPLPPAENLHALLSGRIGGPFPGASANPYVTLGHVVLGDELSIDAQTGRQLLYSNAVLYELIFRLAERVAALAGDH